MESSKESAVETRKTWETPELKKIDVEKLTANGTESGPDGTLQDS
jgi:hypothetical protein